MRISLIDVDSKIPNLALMKISAYHKAKGDIVGFNLINPDKIYSSIVFKKNKGKAKNNTIDNVERVFGGSGYNLSVRLPDEMEYIKPDYDLYPSEYSQGFTTRGCNRNCYFCIVPKKEGRYKVVQHPKEFYDPKFDTCKLLDNNILFDKEWFKEISKWFIDNGIKVDMNQGYDIRLLDFDCACLINDIHSKEVINFAFDDSNLKNIIIKKIDILKDSGINIRKDVQFYVYCHSDDDFDDALYRCNLLKELGTNAFMMFNCDAKRTRRIKNLQRWANRRWLFWGLPFEKYKPCPFHGQVNKNV